MKIFYIVLALIVLYLAIEVGTFLYKYQHYPFMPTIDQTDRTLGSGPTLRYIVAGDSIGVGFGASDVSQTFAYKVAQTLAKDHTVQYKNIAVKGYTTSDVLQKQLNDIIGYKPDIIVISIGGNDSTHLVSASHIIANEKAIIGKLEQGTSAKIYISDMPNFNGATILPWFYISLLEYRSQGLDKQIMALKDDRTTIVNIHDFGWNEEPYNRRENTYAIDHFHPNDLGYQNWTNAYLEAILRP